jgi:apolipoprotein N-acyltransferase
MAALRAVETRRYVLRAGITGVSGIIDPYGRVVTALPVGRAGVVQGTVRAAAETTPYVRFGDAFAGTCVVLALGSLVSRRTRVRDARSADRRADARPPLPDGRAARPTRVACAAAQLPAR